jgi:hypothetical protein
VQGTIIKRHRAALRREGATADAPATPTDIAIGTTITLYGTTYFLVDADAFTRDWYREMHATELPAALPYPAQPLDVFRASRARTKATLGPPSCRTDDLTRFNEARLGKPSHVLERDSLAQFLVRGQSNRVHFIRSNCNISGFTLRISDDFSGVDNGQSLLTLPAVKVYISLQYNPSVWKQGSYVNTFSKPYCLHHLC